MIERSNFAVYLEGEKIPFSNASVSFEANKMSSATISMPSSFSAPNIRRFSIVHIFYQSPYFWDSDKDDITRLQYNPTRSRWYLLWEGVVTGYGFGKTPAGSSFTLMCNDYMSYMEATKVSLFNHKMFDPKYSTKKVFVGQKEFKIVAQSFVNWVSKYFDPNRRNVKKGVDESLPADAKPAGKKNVRQSMAEICNAFLDSWSDNMPLLKFHTDRIRFSKKFNSINDEAITQIFNAVKLKTFVDQIGNSLSGEVPVSALLEKMLKLTYYNYVNIGPCKYNQGTNELSQFILKPELYFATPPLSNIIFPDQCMNTNNNVNYLNSPTRSFISQKIGSQKSGSNSVYIAPSEIADKMNLELGIKDGAEIRDSLPSGAITSGNESVESNDQMFYLQSEIEGALIAQNITLPSELFSIDTDGDLKSNERLKMMSNYQHDVYTLINNTQSFMLKFSPQIVADFPLVYLDKYASVTGYVLSVTHSIDAGGSCSTQVNTNMIRPLALGVPDVKMPPFISQAFSPSSISDTYYDLIGCSSLQSLSYGKSLTLAEIVNTLFSLEGKSEGYYYENVKNGNVHQYINKFTFRSIAHIADVKKHYGMKIEEENEKGLGVDNSWSYDGLTSPNPFDYSVPGKGGEYNFVSSFSKEHKKGVVKGVIQKYKGIIDGR